MNQKQSINLLMINAMIAAVYAVLTLALSPLSYGEIQCRLSEIIVFLAFYNRKYVPGLVIGCLIANLFSPMGLLDIIFGTMSTIFVCFAMNKLNNRYLAALAGSLITGIVVGGELTYAFQTPFLFNALYVAIGEIIVLNIGAFVFQILEKNKTFIELLK